MEAKIIGAQYLGSGWRVYTLEYGGRRFQAHVNPCDFLMHPKGKWMTLPATIPPGEVDATFGAVREAIGRHEIERAGGR